MRRPVTITNKEKRALSSSLLFLWFGYPSLSPMDVSFKNVFTL